MDIAKVNSYEDLVKIVAKSHFKRGIVKAKNRNGKLVREILKVLISIMEIKTFYFRTIDILFRAI